MHRYPHDRRSPNTHRLCACWGRGAQASGFTLMELMIVLALLAAAGALLVPLTTRAFANTELRLSASSLASLFAQAHTRARFEARPYVVIFGPVEGNARTVSLVRDDGKQVSHIELPARFTIRARRAEDDWQEELQPVRFYPDGRADRLQLDLAARQGSHLQLDLDPLTGKAKVSQLYKEE